MADNSHMKIFLYILILIPSIVLCQRDYDQWVQEQNVPQDIIKSFHESSIDTLLAFSFHLNPFYLRGDFDADGKVDYAVMIKHRKNGKHGIAICHSSNKQVFIIGAGRTFGNGDDDFKWIDVWFVSKKLSEFKSHWEDNALSMIAEGIVIDKSESSSAMIYWDGKEFKWYQLSD
jgi:hypothetical protein